MIEKQSLHLVIATAISKQPDYGEAMQIRTFRESDRQQVIALWDQCQLITPWNDPNKDIDRKVNFQANLFFVAFDKSQLIATAMAGYDGHRGSVFYLAIAASYQHQGFGKGFMQYIEQVLTELGCPKLNIVVRSNNEHVLGFYEKQQYVKDDVVSIGKRLIADIDSTDTDIDC